MPKEKTKLAYETPARRSLTQIKHFSKSISCQQVTYTTDGHFLFTKHPSMVLWPKPTKLWREATFVNPTDVKKDN